MLQPVVGQIAEPKSLAPLFEAVAALYPEMHMGTGVVDGEECELGSAWGGVRYFWLESGEGSAWLPRGYRTKEGDGRALPPNLYAPDPLQRVTQQALAVLQESLDAVAPPIRPAASAILSRFDGRAFRGEIAGDLWQAYAAVPEVEAWAPPGPAREALLHLLDVYRVIGWSTKREEGFEPFRAGDQLAVSGEALLRVRGRFRYWWLEDTAQRTTHVSTTRRLPFLKNVPGGCNSAPNAFRRLLLSWHVETGSPDEPDGINRVNAHMVYIAAGQSRPHYHPAEPVGGGLPQTELYLAPDPLYQGLETADRRPALQLFPDVDDPDHFTTVALAPGSTVLIPPGVGHRAIDALVNVVAVPGFKPRNERDLEPTASAYQERAIG